ncbi:cytochrome P450 [Viridothelium virens]|uniref:Cytochrome P450 n=1 Tax=Viridothelium virens TaxID=1048519 RepID=A0A6A6HBE8_VIRVR|nr:cytochrome P450 [Viridothelium virens]
MSDRRVREALPYHSPFIGLMERETPSAVEMPDGRRLSGGVVVGMHAKLVGRNKVVFGEDADAFNPLRWLARQVEANEKFEACLKAINMAHSSFNFGPRSCIGKHIVEMEIHKFFFTLFGLLESRFVRLEELWIPRQHVVHKQSGMDMYLTWRNSKSLANLGTSSTKAQIASGPKV